MLGQITEEFEKLGEKVVKETVKAPKDIAGKALESLGTTSGKQQKSSAQTAIDNVTARAALEELAGRKPKPKEPTVAERLEMEASQKKEMEAKKREQLIKMTLPDTGARQQRGALFASLRAKQSAAERKNVRQD